MSQREQPERRCKSKTQSQGLSVLEFAKAVVPPASRSDSSSVVVSLEGCRDLVSESDRTLTESDNNTVPYPMMSDDERDLESGRGTHPSGLSEGMQSLLRGLVSEFTRAVAAPDRSRDSMHEIELSRQINSLAPHKDGVDMAKYVRKLEADLRDLGCPMRRWKSVLLQKLQSETASSIVAGIDRDETDYEQLNPLVPELF